MKPTVSSGVIEAKIVQINKCLIVEAASVGCSQQRAWPMWNGVDAYGVIQVVLCRNVLRVSAVAPGRSVSSGVVQHSWPVLA